MTPSKAPRAMIKYFTSVTLLTVAVFHGINMLRSLSGTADGRSLRVGGAQVLVDGRKLMFYIAEKSEAPPPAPVPETNPPPPTPPSPAPLERASDSKPACRVFLTSKTYKGDLGGMQGADEKCNELARAAGLVSEGQDVFRAILFSDEETNPDYDPTEFFSPCSGGYYLPNSEGGLWKKVAKNRKHLLDPDSKLMTSIDYFEDGSKRDGGTSSVWTGAMVKDGKFIAANEDCYKDWSSTKNDKEGIRGKSTSTGEERLYRGTSDCDNKHRLYCAEQEYDIKDLDEPYSDSD